MMINMETNFNFKSQICTDKNQSERLLALGLKKETADMKYPGTREYYGGVLTEGVSSLPIIIDTEDDEVTEWDIPAWSLHRLIEMYVERYISCSMNLKDLTYDWIINEIEIHIKEGDFNKEYLV